MNPPSGLTGKANRLSRASRLSQKADPPHTEPADFKTPTRVLRSRSGPGSSGESPCNDSDVQQDIIWDATSPSPSRHGKQGKKQRGGAVDISEIVKRIAPKHGRPEVAEPTLQQWIGDSATIPCTPDVQVLKPKRKSPRPNRVDDLLKLARQFDLNMFHRDEEEEEEEEERRSPDLLSEHFVDFETDCRPDGKVAVQTDAPTDQPQTDELELLFDGPTQHVIGGLSPALSEVKPTSGEQSGVVTATRKDEFEDEFDDDWDNDDLLNDSLVLEMTQNPLNFIAPKYCSTQNPSNERRPPSPAKVPVGGGLGQSGASKVDKDKKRQRATFKLESHPNFSLKGLWTNSDGPEPRYTQPSRDSSPKTVSVGASNSMKSDCRTKRNPTLPGPQRFPPADPYLPDEDLQAFLSSDPVWDDPADDDLFREMCDDLENRIQSAGNTSTQQNALPPANQKPPPPRVGPWASGRPETFSGSTCEQGNTVKKQFTFKKPNDPVTTATSKGGGRCSAAEIELKKQQAMERRRQRLQAAQNPPAPT
ncbi:ewing's tumor-associated antigen 1 isoform X2 [Antennarius striatus]|uniref:ewing's tumor-associated antigen 1 isoform X2 n=1 Tax=Antennarius striatus TaxID=241820 RepID=UPI0035B0E9E1